eukprot:163206-Chlamydomonas_euryale.AAC.14
MDWDATENTRVGAVAVHHACNFNFLVVAWAQGGLSLPPSLPPGATGPCMQDSCICMYTKDNRAEHRAFAPAAVVSLQPACCWLVAYTAYTCKCSNYVLCRCSTVASRRLCCSIPNQGLAKIRVQSWAYVSWTSGQKQVSHSEKG